MEPELAGDDAPVWVELVVADTGRDEVDQARIDERNPGGSIDQLAVDPRLDGGRGSGIRCLERPRTAHLAVEPRVAEPAVVDGFPLHDNHGKTKLYALVSTQPAGSKWMRLKAPTEGLAKNECGRRRTRVR